MIIILIGNILLIKYIYLVLYFLPYFTLYMRFYFILQFDFGANNSYKFLYISRNNVIVFEKSDLMLIVDLFRIIYCLLCVIQ